MTWGLQSEIPLKQALSRSGMIQYSVVWSRRLRLRCGGTCRTFGRGRWCRLRLRGIEDRVRGYRFITDVADAPTEARTRLCVQARKVNGQGRWYDRVIPAAIFVNCSLTVIAHPQRGT